MFTVGSIHEASHALQIANFDGAVAYLALVLTLHHVLLRVLISLIVFSHDVDQNVLDGAEEVFIGRLGSGYIDVFGLGVAVRLLVDELDELLVDSVRVKVCHSAHLRIHILTLNIELVENLPEELVITEINKTCFSIL